MFKNKEPENNYPQIRPFPLYAILVCGLIISAIGLYMMLVDQNATGIASAGRTGTGGGQTISINGISTLISGLGICIFPVYQLIKNSRHKK